MATIPIEVIVQDKETYVDPTPTPETNTTDTTGTTVAVPDTGDGAMNSGINSSASVIIIPAVMLVLAIIGIAAILIRRYNKRKLSESGITRQERRATIVTSTIAVLAPTVLLGQLLATAVVQPNSTNAATGDNTESHIDVVDKISIVIERTEDETEAEVTVENTSTITSTADFGYRVLLAMAEGADTANLYLDGDTTSEYYIAPVNNEETEELGDNIWGYALEEDGEYSAVPLVDDAAVVAKEVATVEDKEIPVYYGVRVGKDLPNGIYTGELTYDLTDYITTMQEMTSDICDAVPTPNAFKADGETIEDNVPTITLTDVRDNKPYIVAKLADGNCWMTKNLDLQKENLLSGITLDNTNTDNPAAGFILPDSQVSGNESWGSEDDEEAINTAHVYDLNGNGGTYHYCVEYQPWGSCKTYGEDVISGEDLGNYYNWYSATAGTGIYSLGDGEVATGSICPAGWRLPNNNNDGSATDYSILMYDYGIITEPTSSSYHTNIDNILSIFDIPLSLGRAGFYGNGVRNVGLNGQLWSSMANSNRYAYDFGVYGNGVYPWYNSKKYYGYSVRCLAE